MFNVELSSELDELLAASDQWNALSEGVPFRNTAWLGPWWKHFGRDYQAFVLIARDESNKIRGLLPLYVQDAHAEFRVLRIVGDGEAFSDYSSIICRDEDALAVGNAMGEFLADKNEWSLVQLEGVVEGDVGIVSLCRAMQKKRCAVHADTRMSTWFRSRNESWDDHLKKSGKTQRRKMRRWLEKITQLDELDKHLPESPGEAQQALESLIELHQKRWNSVGEQGSYASPIFRHFIRDCVSEFYSAGQLYLPTLQYSGKVVSGELHFLGDNRLYCYSSGFDIDHGELEPGRLLSTDTMCEIYRRDYIGVDFLRGDEPYKKRLKATPKRVLRIIIAAPAWVPKIRHAAWFKAFEVKQLMRKCTGRKPVQVVDVLSTPLPEVQQNTVIGAPIVLPATPVTSGQTIS